MNTSWKWQITHYSVLPRLIVHGAPPQGSTFINLVGAGVGVYSFSSELCWAYKSKSMSCVPVCLSPGFRS